MKRYRVLMQDEVNGEAFSFALYYTSRNMMGAGAKGQLEFLTATILSVTLAQQDNGVEL